MCLCDIWQKSVQETAECWPFSSVDYMSVPCVISVMLSVTWNLTRFCYFWWCVFLYFLSSHDHGRTSLATDIMAPWTSLSRIWDQPNSNIPVEGWGGGGGHNPKQKYNNGKEVPAIIRVLGWITCALSHLCWIMKKTNVNVICYT